ncbi:carbon-nitrogen family hydrolase [Megasphaera hominis]|jgi:omega-amidase|uniref:Carbon-nitrogen family hydrolase n=1 Tax=Megasphaera hominis TaxID=159836 RepID=A0ABR6VIW5_9FIRM|nr:carbon-nitrogen family hydrolase [Megasphaera hominis]MBC3536634.1 carbon-nitrogen family hydrolase [Megasphaera hominis]
MKIAAVQAAIAYGDVEKNYALAAENIKKAAAAGAGLVVLSELWNTSFYPPDIMDLADRDGVRTQAFLAEEAKRYGVHIVGGSVANRRGDNLYNTTFVVNKAGQVIATYDKVHLFTPGGEDTVFTPGDHLNVFELDGIKMASITCYDIRFGEWVRMAALAGAQILFVPAAWAEQRRQHWLILNQARAIENQFYVVAVNSCGTTDTVRFGGSSLIADPWGTMLAQGGADETILLADVDFSITERIRQKINVFRDRRPDLYKL